MLIICAPVSSLVKRDVLDKADDMFYSSVMVEDERYFAYYAPLFVEDVKPYVAWGSIIAG